MLENLLKTDFIDVVNSAPVRRGDFGPMKRLGFIGYETSKVILE